MDEYEYRVFWGLPPNEGVIFEGMGIEWQINNAQYTKIDSITENDFREFIESFERKMWFNEIKKDKD